MTRDETAETVSRDQILRRERGQGNINFPFLADQDKSRIDNFSRMIHTLLCMYVQLVPGMYL